MSSWLQQRGPFQVPAASLVPAEAPWLDSCRLDEHGLSTSTPFLASQIAYSFDNDRRRGQSVEIDYLSCRTNPRTSSRTEVNKILE
jgi:hypothetical protein